MIKIIGFWIGVDILGFPNICYHILKYKEKPFKKYMISTNNHLKNKDILNISNKPNLQRKILPVKNKDHALVECNTRY